MSPSASPGSLRTRVAALDEAVGLARGRLPDASLEAPAAVVARARDRAALSGEYTVVALAGATGSGKSSLLNALAEARIAEPGVRRPTTGRPVAVIVPERSGTTDVQGADELLDWLDVQERHVAGSRVLQASATGLVLLDLPDHDSVVTEHRTIAERLYQRVDLLVWVVDPQKYADAALHARYLRGLADHAGVVVLVLNQADRLSIAEQRAMVADLQRLAAEDGLAASPVLAVSATTGAGVAELRELLARAAQRRLAATERVTGDVRLVARALVDACGRAPNTRREVGAAAALVRTWETAAGIDEVADAVRRSTRRSARATTGWPVTRWVARLRPDPLRRLGLGRERAQAGQDDLLRSSRSAPGAGERAAALSAVRTYVDAATSGAPDDWVLAARTRAAQVDLDDVLDRTVVRVPVAAAGVPWTWRVLALLQWALLAVAVAGLLWLVVLAGLGWLRLPAPDTPMWWGIPAPTFLLLAGALAGVLVAGLGWVLGALAGRRRAARARRKLGASVALAVNDHVIGPVAAEMDALARCRVAASKAAA
ncbi:dynamin family protein [Cellulomonas sp. ICMP 17802]|uniref:dynamin family protein n=1 Tax=Cellulomonas sp. ICMP 17802 TaxID=3239199 RepID=UPI00351B4C0F